jgi:ribosome maturation factor RimP
MQKLPEILKIAESEAAPMGLSVVETRFAQQGKRRTLEVTICRKGGRISLDDCEELSRKLEKVLDEQTPALIEGAYMLEVQSPGLERQLKFEREFQIFAGEEVEVKTKESIPTLGDIFSGTLQSMIDSVLTISNPQAIKTGGSSKRKAKASETQVPPPESISIELSKVLKVNLRAVEPADIDN